MAFPERNIPSGYGSRAYSAEIDQGLRSYMLSVYNYMAIGLAVTGGVAALAANAAVASWDPITLTSFGAALYTSPLQWLVMLAPIGLVLVFSFGGIETIGMAAAEAAQPERTIPSAVNSVIWRILIFYIGSLFVIMAIYPWNGLDARSSPFVTGSALSTSATSLIRRMISLATSYPGAAFPPKIFKRGTQPASGLARIACQWATV